MQEWSTWSGIYTATTGVTPHICGAGFEGILNVEKRKYPKKSRSTCRNGGSRWSGIYKFIVDIVCAQVLAALLQNFA